MLCHMCRIGSYWLHGKCAQIFTGDFLCVVAGEHNYPSCSLWRHAASLAVKVSDVTMKEPMWLTCRGEQCNISLPFSFDCTLPCIFFSLQCWNCCWLLWEWRDKWWHPPADVLLTPCKPHCGWCPRQGEHESKRDSVGMGRLPQHSSWIWLCEYLCLLFVSFWA